MPNRASQLLGRAIIVRVLAPLGANTTVKSGFDEKDVAAPLLNGSLAAEPDAGPCANGQVRQCTARLPVCHA
jgi:hypothetical protein